MEAELKSATPLIQRKTLLLSAWVFTLLISTLPDILWQEIIGREAGWMFWPKVILIAVAVGMTMNMKEIRPLQQYFSVFLLLYLTEWLFGRFAESSIWRSIFPAGAPFISSMFGIQLRRVAVAFVLVVAMLIMRRERSSFFFVIGETNAPVRPVRWLGVGEGVSWKKFGWILSLCISLGTLAFILLAARPPLPVLSRAAPMLPAILLFAAMNAFSEEMSYRAPQLATSESVIGEKQALLVTAAFFGIGHYYGVPYGVIGVLMAGFLGWLLGKSMLETRGFWWAWFIHFLQDVIIFTFMSLSPLTPG